MLKLGSKPSEQIVANKTYLAANYLLYHQIARYFYWFLQSENQTPRACCRVIFSRRAETEAQKAEKSQKFRRKHHKRLSLYTFALNEGVRAMRATEPLVCLAKEENSVGDVPIIRDCLYFTKRVSNFHDSWFLYVHHIKHV